MALECNRLRRGHLRECPLPEDPDADQAMGMPAIHRHWTTADVRALMDESRHWPRYELVGGQLLVTPAPGMIHQVAVLEFARIIADYVDNLDARIIERWTPNRPTPRLELARLEWLPEGAESPLVLDVRELIALIYRRLRKAR